MWLSKNIINSLNFMFFYQLETNVNYHSGKLQDVLVKSCLFRTPCNSCMFSGYQPVCVNLTFVTPTGVQMRIHLLDPTLDLLNLNLAPFNPNLLRNDPHRAEVLFLNDPKPALFVKNPLSR